MYKHNNYTYIKYDTLSSNHAHTRLQSCAIKVGTLLCSVCKSYSELLRVSAMTRVFEPYSSKNKSTFFINHFFKLI